MSSIATVTGKVGPNVTLTAGVFTNVTEFRIATDNSMLYFTTNGVQKEVDISADTTITVTKSGNNYTLTVS